MDNVSKEIKEYGMIKTFLPEATALERAVTYRDKKIKPLFIEMKNKIGAMAAQVKELTRERDSWKSKFQKKKQEHEKTKKELAEVQKDYQKLSGEKEILQGIADRYNRLLRYVGERYGRKTGTGRYTNPGGTLKRENKKSRCRKK